MASVVQGGGRTEAEPAATAVGAEHVGGACLNCGTPLAGRYCHRCGQSAHVHRTMMSLLHDLLHGVFHVEGRIWRTIPMLVLHPGALTRRYIAGERARFVSPLALFLFSVFVMFAGFSALGGGDAGRGIVDGWNAVDTGVQQERAQTAATIGGLVRERAALAARGAATRTIDARLADLRGQAATLARVTQGQHAVTVHSRFGWLDARLQRARENPRLVLYKVQAAAGKFSWVLILLSTPLVALLFLWRRGYGLYDHAAFVTYSISFMSLLVVVVDLLLTWSATAWVAMLLLLVPPVHLFAQLRGAYRLSMFGAAWRALVLLGGALMALALFVVGVIAWEVA